ncbi:MAG: Fe-S cluster assembly protein SufD [Acidobacteriota bacterium]
MIETLKENNVYVSEFVSSRASRRGQPAWLQELRQAAVHRFAELGFPTVRDEAWRFTNVAPIARLRFKLASEGLNGWSASALERLDFVSLDCPRMVFVNGFFSPELSSLEEIPAGVTVVPLTSAIETQPDSIRPHLGHYAHYRNHAFAALNTAFTRDGAYVQVSPGRVVEQPIHLLFLSTGDREAWRMHPRTLIVVGANSQLSVVESYIGAGENLYLSNPVSEVVVGDNAVVDHYRLQNESKRAFHIGLHQVSQGRDSRYVTHAIDVGAAVARNDLTCVLNGEGGLAGLNGLYLLNQNQHLDNYTTLEHAKPHCDSRELFKGILDDRARGVFRGRIIVREGAQKTDSKQTNDNLLLSDSALVNTKPQLEIYADDVKCTHGATIGQLDETALFYLRSRGIPETAARSLLVYAFASEVIDHIRLDPLRRQLLRFLAGWLPNGALLKEVLEA